MARKVELTKNVVPQLETAFYDMIICGAGPAGLSIASELSKYHKILVIDKHTITQTSAAWYSYADRVKETDIEKAVVNTCDGLLYFAQDLTHLMQDTCVILDSTKVLKIWYNQAKLNGAEFLVSEFIDYKYVPATSNKSNISFIKNIFPKNSAVKVLTSKGEFSAKLLIDCTGFNSPILNKKNLISNMYVWTIYGGTVDKINIIEDHKISFLPVNDANNSYIGIYPHSKTKADFYIFYNLLNDSGSIDALKPVFVETLKKFYPKARVINQLGGRIVSGELKKYAFDNVIFYGQSGMLDPPACGMGFNEILLTYKKFCLQIHQLFLIQNFSERSLVRVSETIRDSTTLEFQQVMAKFTYYFIRSEHKWRGGVKWLNALGPISKYWMRNEVNINWIESATIKLYKTIPPREFIKVMPRKEYHYVLTHFVKFLGKSIYEEIRNEKRKLREELLSSNSY